MRISLKIILTLVLISQINYLESLQVGLSEGARGNGHLDVELGGSVGASGVGATNSHGHLSGSVHGSGVVNGIGRVVNVGGLVDGARGIIGSIGKETGELVDNVSDGAGNIIGDIGKEAGGIIEGIGDHAQGIFDNSWDRSDIKDHANKNEHKGQHSHSGSFNSSGQINNDRHHNAGDHHGPWQHNGMYQDPYWWTKTGRGIDWITGIGSMGGIRLPIHDLLGLTKSICKVTYAAENLIEKLGEFHMIVDKRIGEVDRSVVDYVTDKYIKKIVDGVRKNHIAFVGFLVDAHLAFDRLIFNTIIEGYRIVKSPVRELFACH